MITVMPKWHPNVIQFTLSLLGVSYHYVPRYSMGLTLHKHTETSPLRLSQLHAAPLPGPVNSTHLSATTWNPGKISVSRTWALPPHPPPTASAQLPAPNACSLRGWWALPSFRNSLPWVKYKTFPAPLTHLRLCLPLVALTPSTSFMDSCCSPV